MADRILDEQAERDRRGIPRLAHGADSAEWSEEAEVSAAVFDRLGELEAMLQNLPATMRGKKGKAKPPKRYPRPKTGMDEAERRRRLAHFEDLDRDVQAAQELWRRQQAGEAV